MILEQIIIKFTLLMTVINSQIPMEYLQELQPLKDIKVCLDAGHGGQAVYATCYKPENYTGGTYGITTHQTESDVNLRVAIYTKSYLESLGAKVIMTREGNCRITSCPGKKEELLARCEIADDFKADYFISIHHNSAINKKANYGVVFYNEKFSDVSNPMAKWIGLSIGKTMKNISLGSAKGNYMVLTHSNIPAVLVEASFLSNSAEDQALYRFRYNENGEIFWPRCIDEAYGIAYGFSMHMINLQTDLGIEPFFTLKDLTINLFNLNQTESEQVVKKEVKTKKAIKSKKHGKR